MMVLENAGTGKCRFWKMTVLENAFQPTSRFQISLSTGVLPFNILVGCEM